MPDMVRVSVCKRCHSHAPVEGVGEPFEVRTLEELQRELTKRGLLEHPADKCPSSKPGVCWHGNTVSGVWAISQARTNGLPEKVARLDGCQRLLFPPAEPAPELQKDIRF